MPQKSRPDPNNGSVVEADEYEGLMTGSAESGIIGTPADTPVVYADATGRQLKVRPGKKGNVRGYGWWSDPVNEEVFDLNGAGLPANTSGSPRIDRIVLRLDRTTRQVRLTHIQGTPAAQPQPPALIQDTGDSSGKWDFPVGRWTAISGYTTIAPADYVYEAWYRPPAGGRTLCTSNSRPQGAYTYLGMEVVEYDTEKIMRWDGLSWQLAEFVIPRLFARRTDDWGSYIGTALRDDRDLWVNVKAGAVYTLRAEIVYASSTTAKFKSTFSVPAGSTIRWNYGGLVGTSAAADGGDNHIMTETLGQTEYAGGLGPTAHTIMRPTGLLIVGNTGGKCQFTWAQQFQDNTYGTQVFLGSWLELTRRP